MNKNKKIRSVVVLGITEAVVLILFLISAMGNYFITKSSADKRSRQLVEDGYSALIEDLDGELKNITKVGYTLLNTESVMRLKAYYYDLVSEDLYARSVAINSVTAQMVSIVSYYGILDSCALWIAPESDELYYNTMYTFVGDDTRKTLIDEVIRSHTYAPQYTGALKNRNGKLVLTMSLSEADNCVVAFILDSAYLLNCLRLGSIPAASAALAEKDGEICVFCTTSASAPTRALALSSTTDKPVLKNGRILYSARIAGALPLYVELKASDLDNTLTIYMVFFIAAFAILCGAAISFLMIFNHFFNRPVKKVLGAMEQAGRGNFDVWIADKISTDFQYVYDGFNAMISSINGYVEENYRQQMMRTESEFKALQAQINPHFLYNCFANIRNLCKMGDVETIELMTDKLSKLFLYITRSAEPIVTLKEETENMLDYLAVQQVRFGDRVRIVIPPLPDRYAGVKIPKLCLQPIVENAYKYVFSDMERGGILQVSYREEGDELLVSVEDNGEKTTDEEIRRLSESLESAKETSGLINVARRLRRYAGGRGRLEVRRGELGGLAVIVALNVGNGGGERECTEF